MRAAMVSVDYGDILQYTLPYNRHHFKDVLVVTTPQDSLTIEVAKKHGATVFETEAFYDDGADFNKWKALEQGLDFFGREGWLAIIDADVAWPTQLGKKVTFTAGYLYSPLAYQMSSSAIPEEVIPPESAWKSYRHRGNHHEWAGYTQIFHCSDKRLGEPPWHDQDWKHAGGADSFFQMQWPKARKIRPPFDVLHIGDAGKNWCGRVTPYVGGGVPEEAKERRSKLRGYLGLRRASLRKYRKMIRKAFAAERIE